MFHVEKQSGDKEKDYQLLLKQLEAMTEDETDQIANYANASALLYHSLPEVNWAGFYFAKEEDGQLVLGPFQVACRHVFGFLSAEGFAAQRTQTEKWNVLRM